MSIMKARFKSPKISFGLDETEKTISLGDSVDVWNSSVFNSNYSMSVLTIIPNVVIGNSKFIITPAVIGEYEIQLLASNKGRTIEVKSNTIKLIVE